MMSELLEARPSAKKLPRATHVRFGVLAFACSLALITYVHRVGFATGAPAIREDLHFNAEQVGYLFSAFFWAYGGFQILGGWLGDRFGTRHLLTFLVLAWSLATGAVAWVVHVPGAEAQLWSLIVLRFLFGALQAGGFPLLARINADWMPVTLRGTSQGLIWMSSRMGGALIPLVLGPMFAWWGNWQTPFWILAGMGLLWCALFWPWFRDRPEQMPRVNAEERALIAFGRPPRAETPHAVPWCSLLRCRSAWALCLAYGFGGFSSNFFIGMLPTYLKDHRHLSDSTTNVLTSLPLAFGVVSCLCGGILSDWFIRATGSRRWGRCLNGSIGLIVSALAVTATIWVEDVRVLAVLLTLTFASNDMVMGPAWAACADIGERSAGTLGGAMNMMANLGGAVSALIAGALLRRGHPDWLFLIFAVGYVLGALSWTGVDTTRRVADS